MKEGHSDAETGGNSIGLVVQGENNCWAKAVDVA